MGQIGDEPLYPPSDPAPSVRTVVSNFDAFDWAMVIASPIAAYPFGFWAGAKTTIPKGAGVCLKKPTAVTAAICGGMAGLFLAMENSAGRLMGFRTTLVYFLIFSLSLSRVCFGRLDEEVEVEKP